MKEVFKDASGQILEGLQSNPDPQKEFAAVFADGYVLLGKTENMRSSLLSLRQSEAAELAKKEHLRESAKESSAAIVTYSNDEARVSNFISTLLAIQGRQLSSEEIAGLQNTLRLSSFSATETRLSAAGVERTTRSAFGQFGNFISLLQPDRSLPR